MTRSGERSALEPDPVPVLHRVRDLCGRFPEGPLPEAEIESLRTSIERRKGRSVLPRQLPRGRDHFKARTQLQEAALAELAEMVRAAASGSPPALRCLSEQLRGLRHDHRLQLSHGSFEPGLGADQVRIIALHLLHTGVSGLEILVGLRLLAAAAEPDDAAMVLELALLGDGYWSLAMRTLKRLEVALSRLFALAKRMSRNDRHSLSAQLGAAPRAEIEALIATLSVTDAIELLRTTEDYVGTPKWLTGNERLAAAVVAAAEFPLRMGDGAATPFSMAWLRDEIRYGTFAFLGYEPGRREEAIAQLGAGLSRPRAIEAVGNVVARRPRDSEQIWLYREVHAAKADPSGAFPAGLAVRFAVPQPRTRGDVRAHLLVDGVPLIPRLLELSRPGIPEEVIHYGEGLRATAAPREVKLAEAECTEGCCGALRAAIRRDEASGRVVWEVWRTRSADEHRERFSFDAAAYDAEIDRAAKDFSWEWPARRAARLLRARLEAEPELLRGCELGGVSSWNWERSVLRMYFTHKGATPDVWLQFEYRMEIPDAAVVDDDAVTAAVEGIVERFRDHDPRRVATILSGSRELAASLGIPWH